MHTIYVARHGDYDLSTQYLTDRGKQEAIGIADQLQQQRLNPMNTIILSSTVDYAHATSLLVCSAIGSRHLIRSPFVRRIGLRPEPVEDVPRFLKSIINSTLDSDVDMSLATTVVIAHQPLLRLLAGTQALQGTIHEMPTDWKNPAFDPNLAFMVKYPEHWDQY
jgi:broad specificity phosphatase PhoE